MVEQIQTDQDRLDVIAELQQFIVCIAFSLSFAIFLMFLL